MTTLARELLELMRECRFPEAINLLNAAIRDKESPKLWSDWSPVQHAAGSPVEAEKGYYRALSLAPNYRDASVNLALLLLAQGRHGEATQYWPLRSTLLLRTMFGQYLSATSVTKGSAASYSTTLIFQAMYIRLASRGRRGRQDLTPAHSTHTLPVSIKTDAARRDSRPTTARMYGGSLECQVVMLLCSQALQQSRNSTEF